MVSQSFVAAVDMKINLPVLGLTLGLQKLNFDATLSVIIPVDIRHLYKTVMEEARNTRRAY